MSAEGIRPRLSQWFANLSANWRWWRGAVASALPEGLRDQFAGGASVISIDLEDQTVVLRRFAGGSVTEIARLPRATFNAATLHAALSPYNSRNWFSRDSFALRLPNAAALKRDIALPLAAHGNIGNLLYIELERQSPVDRSLVYHDYSIQRIDRRDGRMDILWRIIRRDTVTEPLEICRQAGISIAVIAFVGDERPADGGNLPVDQGAAWSLWLRRRMAVGLLLLIVLLVAAIAFGAYARNQEATQAFSVRVDIARIAARASLHLEHEIAATRDRAVWFVREKQTMSVSRVLAETTRILPQGTWLTNFSWRNGEVHIQGVSDKASSLIALIDASPFFTGAEFGAPLVQAQGPERDRFDLTFKIRKGVR